MPSSRVTRHGARREKLAALRASREVAAPYRARVELVVAEGEPEEQTYGEVLAGIGQRSRNESTVGALVEVDPQEVDALLAQMRKVWDSEQQERLLASCRNSVLNSVAGPFGLGAFVAGLDKDGGNVTTGQNARNGVFARGEEGYRRDDYAGSRFKSARDRYKDAAIIENSQMIQDEYSGDYLDHAEMDCDHIVSAEAYHRSEGWRQSKAQRADFGSDSDNFAMTTKSSNRSLKSADKHEWQQKPSTAKPGHTNKDAHRHDNRRVNAAVERGSKTAIKHSSSTLDKALYDGKRVAVTGATEAGKLGLQQSVGLLLAEFFAASFDEISDSYRNGFVDGVQAAGFLDALSLRLGRVAERVLARWKDALVSFKEGAIGGLLSNLVTWLINMVSTTAKRMVRLIREGFASILKALKVALFPPADLEPGEAADAALKLLAAGAITSVGILAEEGLEKAVASVVPFAPFAPIISVVAIGAMTGIATALMVTTLDRLDLFGTQSRRRTAGILKTLDGLIADGDRAIQTTLQNEFGRTTVLMAKLSRS